MRQRLWILCIAGIVALTLLGGCGKSHNRHEVSGEVTLGGKPIDDGIIMFAPADGQATGDGAQIVKGKYLIPKDKGLNPGKYKVSIYAGNGNSGEGDASPDSPHAGKRLPKERVPAEFNEQTKVVKEVVAGGPNKFDFAIP